jgi:hypothetical protein
MLESISRKASLVAKGDRVRTSAWHSYKIFPFLPEPKGLVEDLLVQLLAALAAKTEIVNLCEHRQSRNANMG